VVVISWIYSVNW